MIPVRIESARINTFSGWGIKWWGALIDLNAMFFCKVSKVTSSKDNDHKKVAIKI